MAAAKCPKTSPSYGVSRVAICNGFDASGYFNSSLRGSFSPTTTEEVNLIVHDAAVAGELEKAFHEDLKHSKKLNYEDWQSRPWSEKILELFTIPIKEQL